ncbi:MAG: hypothetical protein AAFQ39_16035, partial [Pseudomonadota bacterium]
VQEADWVIALEVCDYLNIHVGSGMLDDLFAAVTKTGPTDVLSLGWQVFGNAGQAGFINRLLLPRMIHTTPDEPAPPPAHLAVRSLFRPADLAQIGAHRPVFAPTALKIWRNGSGEDVTDGFPPGVDHLTAATRGKRLAQINHYPVRGNAVFALHHLRTPPLTGREQPLGLADHGVLNSNYVTDSTITRWAQATTAEIKRLQSFAGVQAAHKDTVAGFERLIRAFRADLVGPESAPIRALFDSETAKKTMARQTALAAEGHKAPESAAAMQMIAPDDMAPAWLTDLRQTPHKRGWYVADDTFAVQMTTRSDDVLVVSFDSSADVANPALARTTWGYQMIRDAGWSHMGVMAFAAHWYRDTRLFNFLAGQAKTGIFDRFTKVVLIGAEMGGYAATTFADLVPGCTVLAFSPQSTLAADLVPWETRFETGRAADWSGRHRDATDHCTTAEAIYLIYDPYRPADRRHAARYQGTNITHLHSWYAPPLGAERLARADFVQKTLQAAVAGTLSAKTFYPIYRTRRSHPAYAPGLAAHVLAKATPTRARTLAGLLRNRGRADVADDILSRL